MKRRTLLQSLPAVAFFPTAALLDSRQEKSGSGQSSTPVYELRVYHTYEGKLDDLLRRFRDHTTKLFEKHGMKNVAYWTPTGNPSVTIPNGKACAKSPKPMARSSRKLIPPFSS